MAKKEGLVKVEILTDISEEGAIYHTGELRLVNEALANYFAAHGWARIVGSEAKAASPTDVQLDVQSGRLAAKAKEI